MQLFRIRSADAKGIVGDLQGPAQPVQFIGSTDSAMPLIYG